MDGKEVIREIVIGILGALLTVLAKGKQ